MTLNLFISRFDAVNVLYVASVGYVLGALSVCWEDNLSVIFICDK